MKKYISQSVKWFALLTVICAAALITGVILIIANSPTVELQVGLTILSGLMGILFLSIFIAEKSRYLTIDDQKMVLPRGEIINKKMSFQRTVIDMDEICSVESKLHKGDGIYSKNAFFHTLTLKDGTTITFTLYAYGKDAEAEILQTRKSRI